MHIYICIYICISKPFFCTTSVQSGSHRLVYVYILFFFFVRQVSRAVVTARRDSGSHRQMYARG